MRKRSQLSKQAHNDNAQHFQQRPRHNIVLIELWDSHISIPWKYCKGIVWSIRGGIKGGWVDGWPVSAGLSWACESPPPSECPLPTSAPLSDRDLKSHEFCTWARTDVYGCTIEFYSPTSNGPSIEVASCLSTLWLPSSFPAHLFLCLVFFSWEMARHNGLGLFGEWERNF